LDATAISKPLDGNWITPINKARSVKYDSTNQLARWLSMTDTRAKRSKEKEVEDRVRSGKCLLCESSDNNRRGLCMAHYQMFLRTRDALPKAERIAFEEEQIKEGRILAIGQIREIRSPNPFVKSAS
jgi:hypothetical protein